MQDTQSVSLNDALFTCQDAVVGTVDVAGIPFTVYDIEESWRMLTAAFGGNHNGIRPDNEFLEVICHAMLDVPDPSETSALDWRSGVEDDIVGLLSFSTRLSWAAMKRRDPGDSLQKLSRALSSRYNPYFALRACHAYDDLLREGYSLGDVQLVNFSNPKIQLWPKETC